MEEYLAKVVQLFSYLTDKDLFAEIYRNQLAKRLLNQRSASDDMERLMIGGLFFSYFLILSMIIYFYFLRSSFFMREFIYIFFYVFFGHIM